MSLVLAGITHRFGTNRPVLDSAELVVGQGETVAIIGPSGSGKTTLLSIMGGLLAPTSGSVTVDGADVCARPAGSISWVFQGINLLGHRSVADNVALGLWSREPAAAEAAESVRAALRDVGLEDFAQLRAANLSGGQAQRVGVARAMVGRPRYIIADEPTGQLDQSNSQVVAALLVARASEASVVIGTHDLTLAALCQRRLQLADGTLRPA